MKKSVQIRRALMNICAVIILGIPIFIKVMGKTLQVVYRWYRYKRYAHHKKIQRKFPWLDVVKRDEKYRRNF